MIRVQVLSDIHAEISPQVAPESAELETQADLVVLAGDIARAADAVEIASIMFPITPLVMVGGNHEHYRSTMTITDNLDLMREAASTYGAVQGRPIHVLEDDQLILELHGMHVRILGCTFWTDFNLFNDPFRHRMLLEHCMNDFRMIRGLEGKLLSASEWLSRHSSSREFLRSRLTETFDGPTIVVTHHLPSLRSVAPRYQHSPLSVGFASNCDDLVGMGPTAWIHGHTHDSCSWRVPAGTLVICNPAGYAQRRSSGETVRENASFNPRLVLEIKQSQLDGSWRAECAS